MATTWAVTLLLVGYFSAYDIVMGRYSYRSSSGYRSYRSYRSYGTYYYCSSGSCKSNSTGGAAWITGVAISGPFLVMLITLGIIMCCIKCAKKADRTVGPSPPQPSSGISRGTAKSNREKPTTHYPFPPSKANDAPPPYEYIDPTDSPGQNSDSGQINTRTLLPGTIRPPPSAPAPAWEAPSSEAPPDSDKPPMSQPDPPKTTTSNEALDTQPSPVVTAPGASGVGQLPGTTPLPSSEQTPTTAVPTEGGDEKGESY